MGLESRGSNSAPPQWRGFSFPARFSPTDFQRKGNPRSIDGIGVAPPCLGRRDPISPRMEEPTDMADETFTTGGLIS